MLRVRLLLLVGTATVVFGATPIVTAPAQATVPGENGKIVFSHVTQTSTSSDSDIFVIDPNGTGLTQLTSGPALDFYPDWSPDGAKIAFSRVTGSSPNQVSQIFVMDADGGHLDQLTNLPGNPQAPKWSPDGRRIAFIGQGGLNVMSRDGTNVRTLDTAHLFSGLAGLAWSQDGTQIAFSAFDASKPTGGAAAVRVDESGVDWLFDFKFGTQFLDWSPDGSALTFSGVGENDLQNVHIFKWTSAVGVISDLGIGATSAFSPDGEKIAFRHDISNNQSDLNIVGLATMNTDGTSIDDLTSGIDQMPSWQPKPDQMIDGIEFTQAIQELQTIDQLQADLEADGKPPVPIIAGKPAVMRVYLKEVQDDTSIRLEVAGQFSGVRDITLTPGCTPEDRRRERSGCRSVDFYFTPPEGEWAVSVRVLGSHNEIVEDHDFELTSVETDGITLKAVSVCDSKDASGNWQCADQSALANLVSLARHLFPTPGVNVIWTPNVVREDISDTARFPQPINWWGQVDQDLMAMYSPSDRASDDLLGRETYYFGVVRNAIPSGILGTAYLNTRGAAAKSTYTGQGYEAIQWVVAHETGHAMGIDHTSTASPALASNQGCWLGTRTRPEPYPYSDNLLRSGFFPGVVEVGFDVANQVAIPGDAYYEVMGYCASRPPTGASEDTSWITPFSTRALLKPAGPLSVPAGAVTGTSGDFWLVRGTLATPTHVQPAPLVTMQLEAPATAGSGPYRMEVRDSGDSVLFTRSFDVAQGHGSPDPSQEFETNPPEFSELIPVQPTAASILVIDPFQTVIGQIDIAGQAPVIDAVTLPGSFDGLQTISWSVSDPDSSEHTYWVDYSPDGGVTWLNQAQALTDDFLKLDFDLLPAADGQGVFRVIASDGVNSGEAISPQFSVAGKAPHTEIIGPSKTSFHEGDLVWLEAAAFDVDDGGLDDADVTWSSSRDGSLGSGGSLPVYDLSPGTHTITLTARDTDDNTATDSITVTVASGPTVEGGTDRIWGDVKCDNNVNLGDSIAVARALVSLDPGQSAGCPAMGAAVTVESAQRTWGDVDCSGALGLGDAIAIARFLVGLMPNVAGCPVLGTAVKVRT